MGSKEQYEADRAKRREAREQARTTLIREDAEIFVKTFEEFVTRVVNKEFYKGNKADEVALDEARVSLINLLCQSASKPRV